MAKFIELDTVDGYEVFINIDTIQHVTVNEYRETVVSMQDGSYFTVDETYREIKQTLIELSQNTDENV